MAFFSRSDLDDDFGGRDAFLPESWSEVIGRRFTEFAGLALAILAVVAAGMLASYDPNDPSFFNASDGAPSNWLGLPGAYLADPLMRTLGLAAWSLVLLPGVWGWRLVTHEGEWRAWSRLLVAPVAILAAAACLSAHVPPESWPHPYGLGGLIGDGADRTLVAYMPWGLELSLPILSAGLLVATVLLGGLALGMDTAEAAEILRWLVSGLAWASRTSLGLVGLVLGGAARRVSRPRSARVAPPEPYGAARREPAQAYDDEDDDEEEVEDEPPLTARRRRPRLGSALDDEPVERGAGPREPSVLDRIRSAAKRIEPAAMSRREPELDEDEILYDDEDAYEAPVAAPAPRAPAPIPVPQPRAEVAAPLKKVPVSRRAEAEQQPKFEFDDLSEDAAWSCPPLSLLQNPREIARPQHSTEALEENARMLEAVLDDYGIRGEIVKVSPGPVVTMYELEPAPGLKASRVIGLADDIARSMSALAARVSTVPGRSIIGIELPNEVREKVLLRELFAAKSFGDAKEKLLIALGKDIAGAPMVANLARMPHLLIAGTTGSGKSVAINVMILSLLYRLSPKECRMIMIDPKMLELSVYDGIPHLLSPVVTDPKKAVVALKWTVAEMEDRYRKMSRMGVRNIEGYNQRVRDAQSRGEAFTRSVQTGFDPDTGEPIIETQEFEPEELPFIVVVVDEMADLMMVAGKEIEACIQRLAQMARASGIHLIMATQRPSVDVITGTIKANFPTRISFQVTSKIDSRTILGEQGAEQLLGMGDMLYMAGGGRVTRVHGPFVSDEEVEEVVMHLKAQGEPDYIGGVTDGPDEEAAADIDAVLGLGAGDDSEADLYDRAVAIVARDRKCSTSYIQRKLAIGYQRAARLVEQMEEQGVVTPANKVGKREILVGEV
ncbi:DNA translocase FtsK 4TM domain-containing protein [Albimonas sp. CAU 1670]|uniref:DNA translocase FtsK n=1 Tax=Albimonas sp. CAU 1670 TaxID=3032599 RepID=UPI0023D99B70|nr:DNA translocase FtsK [Albimonas sp. CAU 1670]MDF2231438.1 DNA translocase FtsK 4TM domain-containing protein [Albimonas sp. CAU 1670]